MGAEGAVPLDVSALESLYSAPELGVSYGFSADMFSLGMTLLVLWSASESVNEDALASIAENVKEAAKRRQDPPGSSDLLCVIKGSAAELRNLIFNLVSSEPGA